MGARRVGGDHCYVSHFVSRQEESELMGFTHHTFENVECFPFKTLVFPFA